tara:strand:+ start:3570 stop:4028 length:459 start_codon:yes stop_codon:yes gene_type:complete
MNEPYHRYPDEAGQTITEHWVRVAEKCSRTYAVKGAKSMKEAIEFIEEHGTYEEIEVEEGRTIKVTEIDGWHEWEHTFKPQAVDTVKARTCVFLGRVFKAPSDTERGSRFGYHNRHYCYDTFVSLNNPTGICDECTECLEMGWTLQPKEVEA